MYISKGGMNKSYLLYTNLIIIKRSQEGKLNGNTYGNIYVSPVICTIQFKMTKISV